MLVWNGYQVDEAVAAVFADVYGRHAPAAMSFDVMVWLGRPLLARC